MGIPDNERCGNVCAWRTADGNWRSTGLTLLARHGCSQGLPWRDRIRASPARSDAARGDRRDAAACHPGGIALGV